MLHPAQAFFRHREKQFPVAHDARGGVMHLRIINSERQQASQAQSSMKVVNTKRHYVTQGVLKR
jgi:hypothetical protein